MMAGGRRRSHAWIARWPVGLAVTALWCVTIAVRAGAAGQTPQTATEKDGSTARTTLSGIYTEDQAASGKSIFEMTCLGNCHNAASHKGDVFRKNWGGKTVWDLYEVIKDQMPDDNPGVLSPQKSAQIVAYLLKLNALPAGKTELPTDPDTLKKIKIELPSSH